MSELRFKYGFPGPTDAQWEQLRNPSLPTVTDAYTGRELKPGDVYGRLRPPSEVKPGELGSTDQHIFLGLAQPGQVDFGFVAGVMQQKPFSEAKWFFKCQELHRDGTLGRIGWWPVLPQHYVRRSDFRMVIAL